MSKKKKKKAKKTVSNLGEQCAYDECYMVEYYGDREIGWYAIFGMDCFCALFEGVVLYYMKEMIREDKGSPRKYCIKKWRRVT
jgi:hypothetical protein